MSMWNCGTLQKPRGSVGQHLAGFMQSNTQSIYVHTKSPTHIESASRDKLQFGQSSSRNRVWEWALIGCTMHMHSAHCRFLPANVLKCTYADIFIVQAIRSRRWCRLVISKWADECCGGMNGAGYAWMNWTHHTFLCFVFGISISIFVFFRFLLACLPSVIRCTLHDLSRMSRASFRLIDLFVVINSERFWTMLKRSICTSGCSSCVRNFVCYFYGLNSAMLTRWLGYYYSFVSIFFFIVFVSDEKFRLCEQLIGMSWDACRLNGFEITCWLSTFHLFNERVETHINKYTWRVTAQLIAFSFLQHCNDGGYSAASEVVFFLFFLSLLFAIDRYRYGFDRSTEICDSTVLLWIAEENGVRLKWRIDWLRFIMTDEITVRAIFAGIITNYE